MSEPPFGRGDRTVIRPNPGGRRPGAGGQAPSQPKRSSPPPAAETPAPTPASGSAFGAEDWAHGPEVPDRRQDDPQPGVILKRDVAIAPNDNLLLQAASPILLLLGGLRVSLMRANVADLMAQVADAIREFERTMGQARIPEPQVQLAKYALCATADDIVQNIPSEHRNQWTQHSMLAVFFRERDAGVRFYEKLDQAKADPDTNYEVLELMYACLSLGFQGVHRTSSGGAGKLQAIQRSLYELLHRTRPREDLELSPHWRGQDLPPPRPGFRVPFWAPCALLASIVFALFVGASALLTSDSSALAAEMRALFPDSFLALERKPVPVAAVIIPPPPPPRTTEPPPPPPPLTQLQRIQAALAAEIAAKKAVAIENSSSIIIRVTDLVAFPSGSAAVLDSFKPLGLKIAATLDKEPGDIHVTGHTDNVAIFTVRFPSNYELSVERARSVAAVLKPGIADPSRLKIEGKADTQSIQPNTTEEGRAQNRRVEISIPREETLRKP
jgi:type VI secretion system protein ImpK